MIFFVASAELAHLGVIAVLNSVPARLLIPSGDRLTKQERSLKDGKVSPHVAILLAIFCWYQPASACLSLSDSL